MESGDAKQNWTLVLTPLLVAGLLQVKASGLSVEPPFATVAEGFDSESERDAAQLASADYTCHSPRLHFLREVAQEIVSSGLGAVDHLPDQTSVTDSTHVSWRLST